MKIMTTCFPLEVDPSKLIFNLYFEIRNSSIMAQVQWHYEDKVSVKIRQIVFPNLSSQISEDLFNYNTVYLYISLDLEVPRSLFAAVTIKSNIDLSTLVWSVLDVCSYVATGTPTRTLI